ncbi:MAG: CDP-alcohol phosphatidyltransferase family protein [Phycisphaerae bacterium]|nr:CDP-alcohol phosphatidyltransferase family protein [Phycisphaerae bacterium]
MSRRMRQAWVVGVTVIRIPLAAAAAGLLATADVGAPAAWVAVALLLAVEVSDLTDGMLARRWGVTSRFGELLDPYCDSIARLATYAGLAAAAISPWWLLLVLAVRDVSVAYVRILCILSGRQVAARATGKLKAVIQGGAAIMLAGTLALAPLADWTHVAALRFVLVALVATVTLASLVDYFLAAIRKTTVAKDE